MATLDEILAAMPDEGMTAAVTDEVLVIDPNTRQISIPSGELTFGVEGDAGSERKYFLCPRYVGDNVDLTSCFIRVNYRNANGDMDEYLVNDVVVDGDNVVFSWKLSGKAIKYKGQTRFVVCAIGPDAKLAWHTTQATGLVLAGLEPDNSHVVEGTSDVVAQLIGMVNAQTAAVETEGATQIQAVKTAAEVAEASAVAEIEAKGVNTLASIPEDYTALSGAVDGLVRGRAGAIVCEVEGSAIAVNDASDMAIQGLRIFGRSTQDGTPTPDAPVEIQSVVEPVVTVCGKNLFDGIIHTLALAHPAEGNPKVVSGNPYRSFYVCVQEGETYTVSRAKEETSRFQFACTKTVPANDVAVDAIRGDNTGLSRTVTIPKGYHYLVVHLSNSAENVTVENYQVERGTTGSKIEPFSGGSVTITHSLLGVPTTVGGNYTDGNGQQWICDEVDLERGVYVQRIKSVVLDGANIPPYYATHSENGQPYCALYPSDVVNYSPVMSSGYQYTAANWSNTNNYLYCVGNSIILNDNRFTDAEVAKTLWSTETPVIQYVLVTPIETPLSETEIAAYRALHTNRPNTTILNDQGAHMAVAYTADTKLYIDNKIKEALR